MSYSRYAWPFITLFSLSACVAALTPEGAQVRVVSKEMAVVCQSLGRVEGSGALRARGLDSKERNSFNSVRNRVAALGGNAMVIQVRDRLTHQGRGPSYVTRVDALKCRP